MVLRGVATLVPGAVPAAPAVCQRLGGRTPPTGCRHVLTVDEQLKALHATGLAPVGLCQGGYLDWVVHYKGGLYQMLLHFSLKDLCTGKLSPVRVSIR